MTKKQNNLASELADVFRVLWGYLVESVGWIGRQLEKIGMHRVGQVVGMFVIIVASVSMVVDVVVALLLIGDPLQVEQIVYSAIGIELFSYISIAEYVGVIAGGVVMDLAILTLILWLGIYLWNGRNLFVQPKRAWLYVVFIAIFGFAITSTSVFYLVPNMFQMEREMSQSVYMQDSHYKYYEREYHYPNKAGTYLIDERALREYMQEMMQPYRYR